MWSLKTAIDPQLFAPALLDGTLPQPGRSAPLCIRGFLADFACSSESQKMPQGKTKGKHDDKKHYSAGFELKRDLRQKHGPRD
jgi:hypothetical protein